MIGEFRKQFAVRWRSVFGDGMSGNGWAAVTVCVTGILAAAALFGCAASAGTHLTLAVGHRVHPDFHEVDTVAMNTLFTIGDTDYSARAVQFVPDFVIDLKTKKVSSRSNELNNPAVKVEVYKGRKLVDEVWAFLKGRGAPHYARTSLLSFELVAIDSGIVNE